MKNDQPVYIKSFMKIKETEEYFSVGRYSLYNAIHLGELRAYKPNGRDFLLKVVEVEKWIESKLHKDDQL